MSTKLLASVTAVALTGTLGFALYAATSQDAPVLIPLTFDSGPACVAAPVAPNVPPSPPASNLDLLRAEINAIERRIAAANDAQLPVLLLALGLAKVVFQPEFRSPHAIYATSHPNEFRRSL